MDNPSETPDDTAAPAPTSPQRVMLAGWAMLWALLLVEALHTWQRHAVPGWEPWLRQGLAALLASGLLAWRLRQLPRLDARLRQPGSWFARALAPLPLDVPLFALASALLRWLGCAALGATCVELPWWPSAAFDGLTYALCYGIAAVLTHAYRHHAAQASDRLRLEQARAQAQRAQLLQLTRQMEPQFLFNVLNTVSAAVHDDPDQADRLLGRLTSLLRAVTDADRWPQVPLVDEMRLLEAYGELLCARQPERVTLRFDVDPFARDCPVPTLALQPLLDNAFRNTADRRVAHAQLVVRARCEAGRLELTVDDDAGELDGGEDGPGTPAGMGLAHLRERLALLYGNAASLRLLPREGGGVSARLSLPCASC